MLETAAVRILVSKINQEPTETITIRKLVCVFCDDRDGMDSTSDEAAAGGGARAAGGLHKFLVEHRPRCNVTAPAGRVVGGGKRKATAAGVPAEPRYRGVRRRRPRGRYSTEIHNPHKGVRLWLGTFDTAEEAARRYDSEAHRLHGPSTITNFLATLDDLVPLPTLSLHTVVDVCKYGSGLSTAPGTRYPLTKH
jgi:hypothetical protein